MAEAAVRALLYIRLPGGMADERGFAALQEIGSELPAAKRLGLARFKELVRKQYLILRLDEERAIAAIPKLLPDDRRSCEAALDLMCRVIESGRALPEEGSRRLKRIKALFGSGAAKTGRERHAEMASIVSADTTKTASLWSGEPAKPRLPADARRRGAGSSIR